MTIEEIITKQCSPTKPRVGTVPRIRLKDARAVRDMLNNDPDFIKLGCKAFITIIDKSFGVVVRHPVDNYHNVSPSRRTRWKVFNGVPVCTVLVSFSHSRREKSHESG